MHARATAAGAIRRLTDVALVVLVAVCLLALALGRLVPLTGRATFVVAGGSMAPAIPVGAAVIVEPTSPAALAVGDVVSLRSGPARAVFTHRIVRLTGRDGALWVETKGDANASPDPSITPASAVIGRVVVSAPWIGFVVAWLSMPSGIITVLSVGLALLALAWLLTPRAPDPTPVRGPIGVRRGRSPRAVA